jgi:hypothetical protein
VPCDAKGNAKIPTQGATLNLTPFPDGVLFRMTQNSARPGSYILHDAAGLVVAIAVTQEIADILARGAHLFFQRAQAIIKAQDERTTAIELPPAKETSDPALADFIKDTPPNALGAVSGDAK